MRCHYAQTENQLSCNKKYGPCLITVAYFPVRFIKAEADDEANFHKLVHGYDGIHR